MFLTDITFILTVVFISMFAIITCTYRYVSLSVILLHSSNSRLLSENNQLNGSRPLGCFHHITGTICVSYTQICNYATHLIHFLLLQFCCRNLNIKGECRIHTSFWTKRSSRDLSSAGCVKY